MVKLRKDLSGVVYFGGKAFKGGETVPDEYPVGSHLSADGKDHNFPQPAQVRTPETGEQGPQVEPLSEEEQARAAELGLPEGMDPNLVRGAILGYDQGRQDTLAEAALGSAYDPTADGETVEKVNAYLVEHPEEAAAVLAAEAAGEARVGILEQYTA